MEEAKLVLVLLGPTGIGKTSLVKNLAEQRNDVMFLSSGENLWQNGVLQPWTETNYIKGTCRQMIKNTFEEFASSRTHQVLCLDCVKDLEDAEYITTEAHRYGYDIYRALLSSFDSAESMANTWKVRRSPVLRLPKQPEAYLQQWRAKFRIVLNYYRRMNVLSFFPGDEEALLKFIRAKYPSKVGNEVFPICDSGNYIRFLLINSVQSKSILDNLLSLLNLTSFEFSLPVSIVHNARDVSWVADASRYRVTFKAKGVRFLLLKVENGCFLINSNQEVFPCDIDALGIPDNTILEGELLPSSSIADIYPRARTQTPLDLETSVFLVSDVLVFSRRVTWGLSLSRRLAILHTFNISNDIHAALNNGKVTRRAFYEVNRGNPARPIYQTKLPVRIVLKEHRPSTATEIESLLLSSNQEPLCGLVFTPETPYSFGPDSLAFEWQPKDFLHCNINEEDLKSRKRPYRTPTNLWFSDVVDRHLPVEGSVVECKWDSGNRSWVPLRRRYDKQSPDSEERIDLVQRVSQQLYDEWQLRSDLHSQSSQGVESQDESIVLHPAATYEFNELYSLIKEEVDCDRVRKHTDHSTKLEVFNRSCSSSSSAESHDNVLQLCEALVLQPQSKTVVTMSFVSFFADTCPSKTKRDDLVEATVKFDGSLGVAFRWKSRIRVATKQGMNTAEASAAETWIKIHCKVKEFRKGYSYVFETISKKNMAIVEYPFEGLVLLSITNAHGLELGYDDLLQNCEKLGFLMVSPRIHGRLSDVLWYCAGSNCPTEMDHPDVEGSSKPPELEVTVKKEATSFSGALPTSTRSQEGWVIRFRSRTRMKLIQDWWIEAHTAAKLVHPQIIWLLIKYNKLDGITKILPRHFNEEVHDIMNAFGKQFLDVLMDISKPLEVLRRFFDHVRSIYLDLHSKLNEKEDEFISGQAERQLSASPEASQKDTEEDLDTAIRLLTTQFFQALQVFDKKPSKQSTAEKRSSMESQTALQQPEELHRNDENAVFDSTNQLHCVLRDAFENSSEDDKTKFLEMFENYTMPFPSKDDHLLSNFDSSLAKLRTHKVVKLILKAYEEIFSSVCPRKERVLLDSSLSLSTETSSACHGGIDQPSTDLERKSYGFISLLAIAKDVKAISDALSRNEMFSENNRQLSKQFNISAFYTDKDHRNDLRIPILDHIKPKSPSIDYYQPRSYFTLAKHWEPLSLLQDNETELLDSILTSIHGPSILLRLLPNEILLQILELLDALSLIMASRVCRTFHEIITQEKTLQRRISEARSQHERIAEEVYESSQEFYSQDSYS